MSTVGTVGEVARRLAAAGVASPHTDAELLLAHVLGVPRGRLVLSPEPDDAQRAALEVLVRRREAREPLQHLVGSAVLGWATVAVGPGVFVPRPETELLLVESLKLIDGRADPLVVDLCSGTGALALALAQERPDATVHAVEDDPGALAWADRNLEGSGVTLHDADATDVRALAELHGRVDLVTANPPYVPAGSPVDPEVAADPPRAVFAGPDGLAVIRPMIGLCRALLVPGGGVAIEHDESHDGAVRDLLSGFDDVATHRDLTGRPRVTTARSTGPAGPGSSADPSPAGPLGAPTGPAPRRGARRA